MNESRSVTAHVQTRSKSVMMSHSGVPFKGDLSRELELWEYPGHLNSGPEPSERSHISAMAEQVVVRDTLDNTGMTI